MKKKNIIVLIVLLAIGFAAVSTTLVVNGVFKVGFNKDDFSVIFVEALLNGEKSVDALIGADEKVLTFTTNKLITVGESAVLDFKVKNNSTQYGADVTINCIGIEDEYVSVVSEFAGTSLPLEENVFIEAQEVKDGKITAKLEKAYIGEDTNLSLTCVINARPTEKDVVIQDLTVPSEPVIVQEANGYPILTEYGVKDGSEVSIIFDEGYDIENSYSVDGGNTWNEYTGPFQPTSTTVMAKSIKKRNGLSTLSTKKLERPSDALGPKAYDGNVNSSEEMPEAERKIAVSEGMWGRNFYHKIDSNGLGYTLFTVKFYDANGNVISQHSPSAYSEIITVPKNTYVIGYSRDSSSYSRYMYEIRPENTPVITNIQFYPLLTEDGVNQGYSEITINYFPTSIQKLYKIDNGEWKEYEGKMRLELGQTIYAKGIDENGVETYQTPSKTIALASDALGPLAYDGNISTAEEMPETERKIAVSEEMWERNYYHKIDSNGLGYTLFTVKFYDANGNVIGQHSPSAYSETIKIPKNTHIIGYSRESSSYSRYMYEIRPE